mmetsp:Transcript_5711/g.14851  ORF Transcript_5711/g.14851 Transcript_5711/m.14851 type:complete len:384 (-) Transcript_5711:289-1440(-)
MEVDEAPPADAATAEVGGAVAEPEAAGAPELVVHDAGPDGAKDGADDSDSGDEDRRRRRADRFGMEYVPPAERTALQAQDAPGVAKGWRGRQPAQETVGQIDLFTKEEQEKVRKRAERFGIQEPKNLVSYEPLRPPEDEGLRKKRAERFGMDYEPVDLTGVKNADLLETRKDVDTSVVRRPDAIHVYGIDVLSTSDIRLYFKEFYPQYVEWINDSSCNVLFEDILSAKKAVVTLGRPLPPSEAPDSYGIDLDQIPFLWHRGVEDFMKEGVPVPLLFRIATVLDKKHITKDHKTRELWKSRAAHDEIDAALAGGGKQRKQRGGKRRRRGNAMEVDEEPGLPEGITDLRQLIQAKRQKAAGQAQKMDTDAPVDKPARETVSYEEL